jgi:hypothetical protein
MTELEALSALYAEALELCDHMDVTGGRDKPVSWLTTVTRDQYARLCDALHNAAILLPELPEDK